MSSSTSGNIIAIVILLFVLSMINAAFDINPLLGIALIIILIIIVVMGGKYGKEIEKEKQLLASEKARQEEEHRIKMAEIKLHEDNMKLIDSDFGLFNKFIYHLTGVPDNILSNLSFNLDGIDNVTISQLSIDTEKIHQGPRKLDGTPDWRYNSHRWETEVWRRYSVNVSGVKNISFHIRRKESEDPSDINKAVNLLNILVACLKNDESFKINYHAFLDKINLLKESRKTALQYANKLSQLNDIISQLEGVNKYLTDSDILRLNRARDQVSSLRQDLDQQTMMVNELFNDMENEISRVKGLFISLLPKYNLAQVASHKINALGKLNLLLEE